MNEWQIKVNFRNICDHLTVKYYISLLAEDMDYIPLLVPSQNTVWHVVPENIIHFPHALNGDKGSKISVQNNLFKNITSY